MILDGKVLNKPHICPDNFYNDILLKCWSKDATKATKRPSFDKLYTLLNSVIVKSTKDTKTELKTKKVKYVAEM